MEFDLVPLRNAFAQLLRFRSFQGSRLGGPDWLGSEFRVWGSRVSGFMVFGFVVWFLACPLQMSA